MMTKGKPDPHDEPQTVTAAALADPEGEAATSLRLYWRIVARFAGDMAVTFVATGGLTLAGGVLPRVVQFLDEAAFRQAFEAKAPVDGLARRIPTRLVMREDAVLVGMAAIASAPGRYGVDYASGHGFRRPTPRPTSWPQPRMGPNEARSRAFAVFLRFVPIESGGGASRGYAVVGKRLGGLGAAALLGRRTDRIGLCGLRLRHAEACSGAQHATADRQRLRQVLSWQADGSRRRSAPSPAVSFAPRSALIAYMEKNKDWCSFPDEAINELKEHHAKNAAFNAKACKVAAQMKKMKEQAAQGAGPQAQPLPAGPL